MDSLNAVHVTESYTDLLILVLLCTQTNQNVLVTTCNIIILVTVNTHQQNNNLITT